MAKKIWERMRDDRLANEESKQQEVQQANQDFQNYAQNSAQATDIWSRVQDKLNLAQTQAPINSFNYIDTKKSIQSRVNEIANMIAPRRTNIFNTMETNLMPILEQQNKEKAEELKNRNFKLKENPELPVEYTEEQKRKLIPEVVKKVTQPDLGEVTSNFFNDSGRTIENAWIGLKHGVEDSSNYIGSFFTGVQSENNRMIKRVLDSNLTDEEKRAYIYNNLNSEEANTERLNAMIENLMPAKNVPQEIYNVLKSGYNEQLEKMKEVFGISDKDSQKYADIYSKNKDKIDAIALKDEFEESRKAEDTKIAENIENQTNIVSRKLAEISPSMGQMLPGMGLSMVNPVLGTTYFTTSAGGGYVRDAEERGMSPYEAKTYGTIMGFLEGLSEEVITGQQANRILHSFGKRGISTGVLNSTGFNILENVVQEAIMEPAQELTAELVGGKDKANWDNMQDRMFNAGLNGGIMGLISNGATKGLELSGRAYQKIKNGGKLTENEINNVIQENIKTQGQKEVENIIKQSANEKFNQIKQATMQNNEQNTQNQQTILPTQENVSNQNIETKNQLPVQNNINKQQDELKGRSFEDIVDESMANYEYEEVKSPLQNRDIKTIGKDTKTNAYQYDNPEVKPYFQQMAQMLGEDVGNIASEDNRKTTKGGGISLNTNISAVKQLKEMGYSYNQIIDGIVNIIDDHGKENNALSKKLEILIDDQLRNGYTNSYGKYISPNEEYINLISKDNSKVENNKLPTAENILPVQNKIEITNKDNLISSAKKYNLNYKDLSIENSQKALEKRGIKARFDENYFNNESEGGKYILTTDENGNVTREIIINPKADEKTIIQEMAIHELTHDIIAGKTDKSVKMYNEIKDFLYKDKDFSSKLAQLEEAYLNIKDENGKSVYNRNDSKFNSMIEEEAIAKTLQKKFGTQEEVNRLVNYTPSKARMVYDWIVDKLNKITGGRIEKLYWEDVKNKFERAFSEEGNYKNSGNIERHYFNNVDYFDEIEYNKAIPEQLDSKTWKSIDDSIGREELKPGVYETEAFDYANDTWKRYTIMYKEKGEYKIVDSESIDENDYTEGANNELKKYSRETYTGDEGTRGNRVYLERDNKQTKNRKETADDVRLPIRNKEYSDTNRKNNIEVNRNKKYEGLEKSSSFNMPENVKDIKNMNEFLRKAVENETNHEWKERLKDAKSSNYTRIDNRRTPLQYKREIVQQYLDYKNGLNNKDIRYSVSTDGSMKDNKTGKKVVLDAETGSSDKTLLAIHNLNEEKLKGVLELGGFPVPSIAVTNQPHTNFGDISVIFNKNTIDPSINEANKIYSRDAYTARTPNVVNKIIESGLKEVSKNTGIEEWNLRENYKEISIEDAVEKLRRNENIIDKYLKEKGIEIEPIYRDFKGFTHLKQDSLQDFINKHKELINLSYTDKYSTDTYKKYYNDVHNLFVEDIMKEAKISREEAESFYKDYPGFNHWDYFIRDLNAVQELKGKQQLDEYATKEAKEKAVDVESKEYKDYVKNLISPMYGEKYIRNNKDYYTASGNPRSFNQRYEEYTLDNIVKIMNENKGTGQESTWGVGINEIAGDASKRFKNIEDIKKNENLLMTQDEEEHKQILDKYNTEFRDIENSILDKYSDSSIDGYVWREKSIEDAMKNIAKKMASNKKITEQNVISQFDKNGIKITENQAQRVISLIKDLSTLPTNYFEAKPQRAVGFDEIDAIVIPKDVSKEVKQQLKDRGIKTIEYDRNNENERADILKSLNEYKFSKTSESFDEYLTRRIGKEGTRTSLGELKLPTKKQILPTKESSTKTNTPKKEVQKTGNLPTKGETINWTDYEKPNGKIRKHYRSIIESSNTTAEAKAIAKEMMGLDTYTPQSNESLLQKADKRISMSEPDAELNSLLSRAMNNDKVSDVDIAVGERLIEYYSKIGDKEHLQDSIHATALAGTQAGRTVQAMALLNHMTPQGQLVWLQRSIDKMNDALQNKYRNKSNTPQFELTQEMTDKILNTNSKEEMFETLDEVYEELGQQVPKSMSEKIDEWRYFSMLANIKTHGRNMVGNVAMHMTQRAKDKVAGIIESAVSTFKPNMERTHTIMPASKEVKQFAKNDLKNMDVQTELGMNENKYNPQSRLQGARKTFKHDILNNTLGKLFDLNSNLLEVEDNIGLKSMYVKALSEYITANKIDVNNITDAQLSKARQHAIKSSQEATFHQASALATALNQMGKKNNVVKFALDSAVPFKKTPINVAKTGAQYSPVGLIKSAIFDTAQLRKGKITINQYIDNISKGLTGTGIAFMGYALAEAGILKASGGDDDKKEQYDEEQGKQSYSIEIGGKTYSLDWLSPVGIPLFIGAETNQQFNQSKKEKNSKSTDDEESLNKILKSVSNIMNASANAMNPMSEMSMVQGLTSILSSYNKENAVGDMIVNTGKSYVNQFVPTLLGQVARTTDDYERTTKSTKTGTLEKAIDSTVNQIKSKIPGLRQTLPVKTDIWGQEVKQSENLPFRAFNNFVNPAKVQDISNDVVDKELNSLYAKTKESSIIPKTIEKTFSINGTDYRMTNEEFANYSKAYGTTSHNILESLVKSDEYRYLTDEQKQKAIESVYSYAKEKNKVDYANSVAEELKTSTLYKTMQELKTSKNQSKYLDYVAQTKGIEKESAKNKILLESDYDDNVKSIIYANGTGNDDKLYSMMQDSVDINEYLDYKLKSSNKEFSADKDSNGKTITNSAKKKMYSYVNNQISGRINKLLILANNYKLSRGEQNEILEYIKDTSDNEDEVKEKLKKLSSNFELRNDKIYYK
jgi:hypothetical protein